MASDSTSHNEQVTRLRVGGVLAVAVVVGFVVWFAFIRDTDSGNNGGPKSEAASATELQNLALEVGHPVYWVGARPRHTYEVTRNSRGDVFIRYLPAGVPVGDQRPNYLTVGTYPFRAAYATLQKSARRKGTISGSLPNRGIYIIGRARPSSVYLAYRGQDLQIEVFAPSPSLARQLVTSRRVRPVG
jgi:hypothetical protein